LKELADGSKKHVNKKEFGVTVDFFYLLSLDIVHTKSIGTFELLRKPSSNKHFSHPYGCLTLRYRRYLIG
jgi:hypothetical protein